ncbi:type IV-A pilus assembly ATPase PilB [bacterium]|nr:type IV-A pilus assembly ATPase PilB [bacterium]
MPQFLGEILIDSGVITNEQLKLALEIQKNDDSEGKPHKKIGEVLVENKFITEEKLYQFLAYKFNMEYIDLSSFEDIPKNVITLVPGSVAKEFGIIPLELLGKILTLVISDPTEKGKIEQDIQFRTGMDIQVMLAPKSQITDALQKFYQDTSQFESELEQMETNIMDSVDFEVGGAEEEENEDAIQSDLEKSPMVAIVKSVIINAVNKGVSDIHFEVFEKEIRIRYRLDGILKDVSGHLPSSKKNEVTAIIKTMAGLRIDEKRVPQDGRIKMKIHGREVDFRVSTLPCIHGEKIVLRILDKGNLMLDMTKLGFEEEQLKNFTKAIESPWGMLLITGPTGSGKTTTLYSALSNLNKGAVNIMTAEDPVEYNLKGINQVQIHAKIGMTFSAALKAFLRQDPDIIMVGEIRDYTVAEIAIKAALTGHLVLSTLHTNDAPSSITRLVDIGIEPFLVASSMVLVMAQRLVRRVCTKCAEPYMPPEAELKRLHFTEEELKTANIMKGTGCSICNGTGYKGRLAIYEIMPITEEISELITAGATAMDLKKKAMANGMHTLHQSARNKFLSGQTTLEEVLRVTGTGEEEWKIMNS